MPIVDSVTKDLKPRPCASCEKDIGTADYMMLDGKRRWHIACGKRELGRGQATRDTAPLATKG